jgi:hypothetical protein
VFETLNDVLEVPGLSLTPPFISEIRSLKGECHKQQSDRRTVRCPASGVDSGCTADDVLQRQPAAECVRAGNPYHAVAAALPETNTETPALMAREEALLAPRRRAGAATVNFALQLRERRTW